MPLPSRSEGPPFAWPAPIDAVLDTWAAASGRVRTLLRIVALALASLAASGGLVRGPWGAPVEVVVVRHTLAAGTPVTADDLSLARRPTGLVAHDTVRDPTALPPGTLTSGVVTEGSTLTWSHVVVDGPAGAATAGTAVVPVPAELVPQLPIGTRLDVAVPGFDGHAEVVARDATLVADDGSWRWLRVQRDEVAAIAAGVSDRSLVIAVLPPPRGASP